MEVHEITDLIVAVATLISAITAALVGLHNSRKIQDVHVSINSRMDQLLTSNRVAAHSEGREEARKEEQERSSIDLK